MVLSILRQICFGPPAGSKQIFAPTDPVPPLVRRVRPSTRKSAQPLNIPCPDPTAEDSRRAAHRRRGQFWARQEDWPALSQRIHAADNLRHKTPGGMPIGELLSLGARSDVVSAAEHALLSGQPAATAPLIEGVDALEAVLEEHSSDPMIACVVAHAHLDIAWAWRSTRPLAKIPARNREAFDAHLSRAQDILSEHSSATLRSPLLASVNCIATVDLTPDADRVARAHEHLIMLDPHNPQSFRTMGIRLLPRWGGSIEMLELQARRVAAQTQPIWGAGGYCWTMLDAILRDDRACAQLDIAYFCDGLKDILDRCVDQHIVNLLAAYCANTMGTQVDGSDEAALVRAQIGTCADWIIRHHLNELHPMIWAHAARGFDQNLRVRCASRFATTGMADAHRIIKSLFRREIADGKRIVFTKSGAEALAA